MRRSMLGGVVAVAAAAASVVIGLTVLPAATATTTIEIDHAPVTTLAMTAPTPYTPHAQNGGTDDYHCTLVDPHVTENSFIEASQFFPGSGPSSVEVHHAILFMVPPSLVSVAETANDGGKGWTCFGEPPVLGTGIAQFLSMPWLSAWAPGHGKDVMPLTTGTPLPKGSLIIMQVHYNLLLGDRPVRPRVKLWTVPASARLRPASIQPLVALPNIPCPAGITGPLCNRTAEMANLEQRFGTYMGLFDDGLAQMCGENPDNLPEGDSTSCTSTIDQPGYIVRTMAHMHLLGVSLKITLNPGTPQAQVVLDVPNYNFHYQRAYNAARWVHVTAGEPVQVSCTYNPQLAQEIPALRKLPPHFVTWGDGSSDEMCLGLMWEVPTNPDTTVDWAHLTGGFHLTGARHHH